VANACRLDKDRFLRNDVAAAEEPDGCSLRALRSPRAHDAVEAQSRLRGPVSTSCAAAIKLRAVRIQIECARQEQTMRRVSLFLLVSLLALVPPVGAAEFGTKAEAVAMVKRAQEMYKTAGPEATFKAVTDKSVATFHDRDLYPFIYDMAGVNVAHGAKPALVGKNLIGLKDQGGKLLVQELRDVARDKGSGWVDYKWPNPITNKIEEKSSYVEKMGDNYWVGVGVYR
jgi:hypothetical protein